VQGSKIDRLGQARGCKIVTAGSSQWSKGLKVPKVPRIPYIENTKLRRRRREREQKREEALAKTTETPA
jgi:hypothetical protein